METFETKFTQFNTFAEQNPIEAQLATQANNGPDGNQ